MLENFTRSCKNFAGLCRILARKGPFLLQESESCRIYRNLARLLQESCKTYMHRSCRILQDGFYWVILLYHSKTPCLCRNQARKVIRKCSPVCSDGFVYTITGNEADACWTVLTLLSKPGHCGTV